MKYVLGSGLLCGLTLLGCDAAPPRTTADAHGEVDASGPRVDAPLPDAPGLDAPGLDAPGLDAFNPEVPDAGPAAVDCSAIGARWMLCSEGPDTCAAVFTDGAGCAAVCAAAGLVCLETYEDAPMCTADRARPALSCSTPSGHASDYCLCGRGGSCTPSCGGAVCGSDGCGGSCGSCGSGERCEGGACVPTGTVDCSGLPYDPAALRGELVGFGRFTTGGNPRNVYHVTNTRASGAGSLRAALESTEDYWIVFDIGMTSRATIDMGDVDVRVRSNKTVDGRGRDILMDGGFVMRAGTRNVIFTDVMMTNSHGTRCTQDADIVSISGAGATTPAGYETRDIWFHHVELFEGGDGLIDVRGGSRITISWSSFHDHSKGFLFSMASATALEGREMEITMHHNYFNQLSRRSPQLSWGRVHLYNNYQRHWWEFGAASIVNAQMYSEGNIFEARPGTTCGTFFSPCMDPAPCGDDDYNVSKEAISNNWASESAPGNVRSVGDLLLNDAMIASRGTVFTPAYTYTAETATMALATRIQTEAGPRRTYCRP